MTRTTKPPLFRNSASTARWISCSASSISKPWKIFPSEDAGKNILLQKASQIISIISISLAYSLPPTYENWNALFFSNKDLSDLFQRFPYIAYFCSFLPVMVPDSKYYNHIKSLANMSSTKKSWNKSNIESKNAVFLNISPFQTWQLCGYPC